MHSKRNWIYNSDSFAKLKTINKFVVEKSTSYSHSNSLYDYLSQMKYKANNYLAFTRQKFDA